MKAKINPNNQDIEVTLSRGDFKYLLEYSGKQDFFGNSIRCLDEGHTANFFLSFNSCDQNPYNPFEGADDLGEGTLLRFPEHLFHPYLINIGNKAIEELKSKGGYLTRMVGGSKLFVMVKDEYGKIEVV